LHGKENLSQILCALLDRDAALANSNAGCCCRPWYSFAATDPKDIIVMIDMSSSMLVTYLTSGEKKLTVAIKAAQAAIKSLNPNDNVSRKLLIHL